MAVQQIGHLESSECTVRANLARCAVPRTGNALLLLHNIITLNVMQWNTSHYKSMQCTALHCTAQQWDGLANVDLCYIHVTESWLSMFQTKGFSGQTFSFFGNQFFCEVMGVLDKSHTVCFKSNSVFHWTVQNDFRNEIFRFALPIYLYPCEVSPTLACRSPWGWAKLEHLIISFP